MNPTYALGWTLLHFLWQGAAIAILSAAALAILRGATARTRYLVSCAALLLMLSVAVATFVNLSLNSVPGPAAGFAVRAGQPRFLPALVWCWFAGVALLGLRAARAWLLARRFSRRGVSPAAAFWQEKLTALTAQLSISKPVRLAVSTLAEVPAVVGWLRPVVLLPASALTGLTASQIEVLLAHELAHIRRNDYLVNLFQTAAETLFFYHPAVWWLSSRIREERENCCDDLAIEVCGSRLLYVRALTDLEQLRGAAPRLAMAAAGGGLLRRVERLLNIPGRPATFPIGWTASAGIAATLLFALLAANGLAQNPATPAPPTPVAAPTPPTPPAPPARPSADDLRQQQDMQRRKADIEKQRAEMLRMREELRRSVDAMKERRQAMEPEIQRLRETVDQIQAEISRHNNLPAADLNNQLEELNEQIRRLADAVHRIHPSN